jgi:hypothetical protein
MLGTWQAYGVGGRVPCAHRAWRALGRVGHWACGARGGRWAVFDVGCMLGHGVCRVGVSSEKVVSIGILRKEIKHTFFLRRLEETQVSGVIMK